MIHGVKHTRFKIIKGGAGVMEAVIKTGVYTTNSATMESTTKSDWEEISEWGCSLAKKNHLTKEDSRRILQYVRNNSSGNHR